MLFIKRLEEQADLCDLETNPLSRKEEEMLEIKQSETRVEIGVDSRQATLAALAFPFDKNALNAIETYWKKGYDYVQLGIGNSVSL